jgi:RNA polymerase sigma-70 factor (ECF subfamily)
VRVFRAAGTYQPRAAFTTWLYRIVANLCADWARRPRLAHLDDESTIAAPPAEASIERDECRRTVRMAVAALPERQRLALLLHRFEGQTHAQIAQAMETSESAVESLLVRDYAELRRRLVGLIGDRRIRRRDTFKRRASCA